MAKVIILAAGEGSRLSPLTKKNPKCLVSFLGKTLLEYQLNVFEKFMRSRKLMLNLVRKESKNTTIQDFGKTTNIEKKMLNKLCAIYTTKMFPEIMPDDVPK